MLTRTEYRFDVPNIRQYDFVDLKTTINQPSGSFFYDPWEIKLEYKGTIWEDLLNSLPFKKGEARIINMAPGTTYYSHADIDDRWHYNLQSQRSYLIDLDNEQMFLLNPDGYWYDMDAGKIHVACNFGSINRLQLVIRKLLIKTTCSKLVTVKIKPSKPQNDFIYKFDNLVSPWLNTVNKKKSMKDFSFLNNEVIFKVNPDELTTLKLDENYIIEIR